MPEQSPKFRIQPEVMILKKTKNKHVTLKAKTNCKWKKANNKGKTLRLKFSLPEICLTSKSLKSLKLFEQVCGKLSWLDQTRRYKKGKPDEDNERRQEKKGTGMMEGPLTVCVLAATGGQQQQIKDSCSDPARPLDPAPRRRPRALRPNHLHRRASQVIQLQTGDSGGQTRVSHGRAPHFQLLLQFNTESLPVLAAPPVLWLSAKRM